MMAYCITLVYGSRGRLEYLLGGEFRISRLELNLLVQIYESKDIDDPRNQVIYIATHDF